MSSAENPTTHSSITPCLIDSHCHLTYPYEGKTAQELVTEAQSQGVGYLITIATEPSNFKSCQEISEGYSNVYHSIGVHPHDTSQVTPQILHEMKSFLTHPKCVAVGEIGLDYYYEHTDRKKQQDECWAQLELALEFKKPVIIHSRDAEDDLLTLLKQYARTYQQQQSTHSLGVIHCFSGTPDFAKECIELGFYISFSGILTFKNAEAIRIVATQIPKERILVETDAPFLAPVPLRGKKCEPFMVKHTALKLSEVLKLPFDDVVRLTFENTKKCFQLAL